MKKKYLIFFISFILILTIQFSFNNKNQNNRTLSNFSVSNFSSQKLQKNFKNWGILSSNHSSDIHAFEAWKIQEGSRKVIVAVVDTGIDQTHPDLAKNILKDGWNYVSKSKDSSDDHGHGTHVAGIIGAIVNQNEGTSGVAHNISILPVKYYSESNSGNENLTNTINALNFAIDHGAQIINYSGGGPEFSLEEYKAIKRAESKGILVVAAAGNEHQNTDIYKNYYYPSGYHLSNIISVAATNKNNELLPSSNWGKKSVDVAAPGEDIYSTLPGGRYGYMTGTSQATAFVTGVAALLLSQNPQLKPDEIKKIILNSVDTFPSLQNKLTSGGRINAYAALKTLQKDTPSKNKQSHQLYLQFSKKSFANKIYN